MFQLFRRIDLGEHIRFHTNRYGTSHRHQWAFSNHLDSRRVFFINDGGFECDKEEQSDVSAFLLQLRLAAPCISEQEDRWWPTQEMSTLCRTTLRSAVICWRLHNMITEHEASLYGAVFHKDRCCIVVALDDGPLWTNVALGDGFLTTRFHIGGCDNPRCFGRDGSPFCSVHDVQARALLCAVLLPDLVAIVISFLS